MRDRVRRAAELVAIGGLVLVALWAASREIALVRVAGASMAPALACGDVCVVRKGTRPARGDVVLVSEQGRAPLVHRVTRTTSQGLVLRGDANPVPDLRPVSRTAVVGTVVAVIPAGKLLERWRGQVPGATIANQSKSSKR